MYLVRLNGENLEKFIILDPKPDPYHNPTTFGRKPLRLNIDFVMLGSVGFQLIHDDQSDQCLKVNVIPNYKV